MVTHGIIVFTNKANSTTARISTLQHQIPDNFYKKATVAALKVAWI